MTGGGSDGASYCLPKKIHEPEILHPKKYLASTFPTQKNTRLSTSILIYSITQTLRPKKKHGTDLLTQKNTEGVNFQPKKIRRTSPSCVLHVPPPPPWGPEAYPVCSIEQLHVGVLFTPPWMRCLSIAGLTPRH